MQNIKPVHKNQSSAKKTAGSDLERGVMEQIASGRVKMKPRWYFVVGSALFLSGLIGLSTGAIFLVNLTLFLLRRHGPMGQWRLEMMISSFPLWVPAIAVVCVLSGIFILKRYDFSYKYNFLLIGIAFLVSVVASAILIDSFGINENWSRRGPMRRFYQQFETEEGKGGEGSGRNGYGGGNRLFR